MSGIWIPSRRAILLFAIVIVALLAFSAANVATVAGGANGLEVLQNTASDNRELGAWLLMVLGLGAVAFALRCRRFGPAREQFV